MRFETVKSPEIERLMNEKGKLIEEGRKMSVEINRLTTEQNKLAFKAEKIVAKISKIMTKLPFYKELGEFETPRQFKFNNGEVEIEIVDAVEEYKEGIREARKQREANRENDLSKLKK